MLKLLGLILIIYALVVAYSAFAKPGIVWNNFKVEAFKKVLGEKGTVILFYVMSLLALFIGFNLLF